MIRGMAAQIGITVLLFASLRERAGTGRLTLRVPDATPVGAVWGHLPEAVAADGPPAGLRYALNETWTVPGAPLRDGDRVALVLPVSGG
jgi:molybdopterin converting factor small subunit